MTTKSLYKYLIPTLTVIIAAFLYWFWAFPFRAALSYREQLQLFQTTLSYFRETIAQPWGVFRYAGEFLVQFFNNYWIGAAVMTAMLIFVMMLTYGIIRRIAPKLSPILVFTLSIIPLIAVWIFLGNPSTTLALPLGIILVLAAVYFVVRLVKRGNPAWHSGRAQIIAAAVIFTLEIVAAAVIVPVAYDANTYKIITYDYLVRANDWDGILEYAEKSEPDLPLSVSATNLALGMTGQLDSRAFDFFQNGPEGLAPPFQKETLSSWTTGEIFFQLGMVNSAQRFYFEGMEAIPDYRKSSRAIRRLAETAIIRGEYAIAEKYLKILKNTLFYKKWALRNLDLIKDDKAVALHPLYGRLRASMIDEKYMFSEGELDKTFGQLFLKNPGNQLAKQYLVVYPLLQRDIDKFVQYMGVVAESQPNYNPYLAQQVMAFMAMKNGQPIPQGGVSPAVEQQLRSFARAWTSKNPDLLESHRQSLFYYLLSPQ